MQQTAAVHHKEMHRVGVDWIVLVGDRDKWRSVVATVTSV